MILELHDVRTVEELELELNRRGMRRLTQTDTFMTMLNSVRVFWSDVHGMRTSMFVRI